FARSRRRYGGYVVHLGIVLLFLGFAGNGSKREEEVSLKPGQQVALTPYVVRYDRLSVTDDGQKQMGTGEMSVTRNDKAIESMYPARWFYRNHESSPTTEVALRRGFADDLYLDLAGYTVETQVAQFKVIINPLVNWIWFGVGVMMFGTLIALLPERTFAFAAKTVPEAAVTTTVLLVLLVVGSGTRLWAQHVETAQGVAVIP